LNNKSRIAASEWLENLDFGAWTENSYLKKLKCYGTLDTITDIDTFFGRTSIKKAL
jgi:hypothetical protein